MLHGAREAIGEALEKKFTFLFGRLAVTNTRAIVEKYAPFVPGSYPVPGSPGAGREHEDVTGLAD